MRSQHLHKHLATKKRLTNLDKATLFASFTYPLSAIPQVTNVLEGNTAGVSLLSWTMFAVFGSVFLCYGVVHNIKPMIINNSLWLIIDALVIIGIVAAR